MPAAPSTRARLFRVEAIEHASVAGIGSVVLARPVSYAALTALFALIAACIFLFFAQFEFQRKVQVSGVLVPETGLLKIVSSQGGVVAERQAREGQAVKAGDPLFVLSGERASVTRGDAVKAVSTLLGSRRQSLLAESEDLRLQSAQHLEAVARRAGDLAQDIARAQAQIELQQRRVLLSEEAVKRVAELHGLGFMSSTQLQDKQGELLDQRQRLADLERSKAAAARDLASAQAELREQRIQAQRDLRGVARNIATLEQDLTENEARRQVILRAPQDGVVTAISADLGQTVAASQTLASVIPRGTALIAEVYAPSRAAGFVKVGMDVLVRYQAYPYQKFGQHRARVVEVSNTAMRPEELSLPGAVPAAAGAAEPLYRVRLALDQQAVTAYGTQHPLKSGMLLDASVMLEKRRLYEWVLEPLFTVTGRL